LPTSLSPAEIPLLCPPTGRPDRTPCRPSETPCRPQKWKKAGV